MKIAPHRLASILTLGAGIACCVPPRATPRDAGTEVDGGSPIVFSLGVTDNNSATHQVAPYITLSFETGTLGPDSVLSRRVTTPPTLDGLDSDWASIAGSVVSLHPDGAAIGMSLDEWNSGFGLLRDGGVRPYDLGIDSALVKSAFDDTNLYLLVQWSDSTKNDMKGRLTLADGGWARNTDDEDRLFLAFDVNFPDFRELGCAAACHLRERVGDNTDAGIAYRTRMHTNAVGERADLWSWGAFTTNPMNHADDISWDQAGRVSDNAAAFTTSNRRALDGGALEPLFMSEDGVNASPAYLYAPDAGGHPAAVPFDGDGAVPGTSIPGVLHQLAGGSRADIRAVGQWRNGKWTVEFARRRVTDDPNDAQFLIP